MAVIKLMFVLAIGVYAAQAASFSDLTSQRACGTYKDCDVNECCVFPRQQGLGGMGKRDLFGDLLNGLVSSITGNSNDTDTSNSTVTDGPLVDMTNSTGDAGTTAAPPSSGGLGLSDILGWLSKAGDLQKKAAELAAKKKQDLADLNKHLSDNSHISDFLNASKNRFNQPTKQGVCKALSAEGEACANHLNAPVCPCGDNLDCKVDKDATFSGFGAIHGFHNLRCVPI